MAVAPATYNVNVGVTIGDSINGFVTHTISVPVVVAAMPSPMSPVKRTALAIPNLSYWEGMMTSVLQGGGDFWCRTQPPNMVIPTGFIYTNTGESLGDYRSIWYYDGARSYYQIADYTGNSAYWSACGSWISTDYAGKTGSGFAMPLDNEIFAKGLYTSWLKTGNSVFTNSLSNMIANSPLGDVNQSRGGSLLVPIRIDADGSRDPAIRSTGLYGELHLYALKAGLPIMDANHIARIRRNAEWIMLYMEETYILNNPMGYDQPFYDGIAAEFLIRWWEFSGDVRVPRIIKAMLDWHWVNTVQTNNTTQLGWMKYSAFKSSQLTAGPPGYVIPLCSDYNGGCSYGGVASSVNSGANTVLTSTSGDLFQTSWNGDIGHTQVYVGGLSVNPVGLVFVTDTTHMIVHGNFGTNASIGWDVPQYKNDLTYLFLPAFGWYWSISGDETYRTRGDILFNASSVEPGKGKSFSQSYYWSTDYVSWRTNIGGANSTYSKGAFRSGVYK